MAEARDRTPSLPMSRDNVDAGMIRRPVRSFGDSFKDFLSSKDTVQLAMIGSVSSIALFPQTWLLTLPAALSYYSWVATRKFRLPFKVPQNWGGTDFGSPSPGGRGFGKAGGILYFGQDQASQEELWIENGDARRHGFFLGTTGSGKALRGDALILTTRGWVFNRDLVIGDELIHPFGGTNRITSIHPQGKLPVVRVNFADGRHADCCRDHLWQVKVKARTDLAPAEGFTEEGKVMSTADLGILHGLRGNDLQITVPLALPHDGLPIPEGSGILSLDHAIRSADQGLHHLDYMPSLYGTADERIEFLRSWMRNAEYKIAIEEFGVRLRELRTPDALILKQIVWSLGGMATTYRKSSLKDRMKGVDLVLNFRDMTRIWPQASICKAPSNGDGLEVTGVEALHEEDEMSCVKTERDDGLYIMDNHVVTHNTELLLGVVSQTLMWSSGFLFIDGKGTTEFYARAWSLCKRFGREDDIRVLNFTDGGDDPDAPSGGPNVQSNTLNPFSKGSADQLMNLIVGLMGDAGAGNDMWKSRAMSLVTAAMKALCIMRDSGDILLDVQAIRDFLPLGTGVSKDLVRGKPPSNIMDIPEEAWDEMRTRGGMIELYLRSVKGDFSNASRLALKGFFDSLPGFNLEKALKGDSQPDKASEQYNFLSMQLTKPLGSLADDYGHIFRTPLGEVDIDDIVLNRRILVVLLPALQKAAEEMQNCGKIVVNLVKIMMGNASGSQLQGSKQEIVDSKQTRAPSPFICVLDEAGYYMVKGIDVMMAQARSLGFMVIVAGQDMAAMQSINAQIAETAMANASIFAAGKITDADKTLAAIQKLFGRTQVSVTSGYQAQAGVMGTKWVDRMDATFQEIDKVKGEELQNMMEGEFYFLFNGTLVRSSTFYVGTLGKGGFGDDISINKFIKVRGPTDRVPGLDQKVEVKFLAGYAGAIEKMLHMGADPKKAPPELVEDGLTGLNRFAGKLLWKAGKKAGNHANIHAAWLGALMSISQIEDMMPDGSGDDDVETWDAEDLSGEESLDMFKDGLPSMEDLEADFPIERPKSPPRGGSKKDLIDAFDNSMDYDANSEIAGSLNRIAESKTEQQRHGGLIDLLLAQDSARNKARQNREIDKLAAREDSNDGSGRAAQRKSFGEFFNVLAENSSRFAKIFAEEEIDGDLGIEILRRSGNVKPLPLDAFQNAHFMDDEVGELEKILSTEQK